MRTRLTRILELVGVNSLPVVGVIAGDWTSATALALYWAENLIAAVLITGRLWLHRRWTAGRVVDGAPAPTVTAPAAFLTTALPFTLAHGLFLAVIFAIVMKVAPDFATLRAAVLALAAWQALAFGVDLWTLERWPAARVTAQVDHLMGRVVVVHLSIIAGMLIYAWLDTEWAFFSFFAGMKLLIDLGSLVPRAEPGATSAPPPWLSAVMRRVPGRSGETFDQYWARTSRSESPQNVSPPEAGP